MKSTAGLACLPGKKGTCSGVEIVLPLNIEAGLVEGLIYSRSPSKTNGNCFLLILKPCNSLTKERRCAAVTDWVVETCPLTADFKTHGIQDWDSYVWVLRKYVNFIQCCKEIQAGAPAPCLPPPLLRPKSFGDKGNTPEQTWASSKDMALACKVTTPYPQPMCNRLCYLSQLL